MLGLHLRDAPHELLHDAPALTTRGAVAVVDGHRVTLALFRYSISALLGTRYVRPTTSEPMVPERRSA
jgi:hypothetical protein